MHLGIVQQNSWKTLIGKGELGGHWLVENELLNLDEFQARKLFENCNNHYMQLGIV